MPPCVYPLLCSKCQFPILSIRFSRIACTQSRWIISSLFEKNRRHPRVTYRRRSDIEMSRRSSRRLSSDEFRRGDQVWLLDNGELYFATVEQRVIGSNRLRLRINRKDINLPSKDQLDNARQYEPESLIRHHDHSSLVNSFQRGDGLSLFNLVQLPHECMTLADIVFHYFRAANNMNSEGRKISTMACLVPFGDNSYILKCPELNSRKLSTVIFSEQMKMSTRDSILQRIKQGKVVAVVACLS